MGLLINKDVIEGLKLIPDESVDCVITSPPYWGMRDYGVSGQIGLEKTLNEYLDKLLKVTAELKRVLKKTGVVFWNHGDCYSASGGAGNQYKKWQSKERFDCFKKYSGKKASQSNLKPKCSCMQNYRLIQRMIDEQGWILRNQIIWHKPNAMPASVKDRFTVDFEPLFMLTKSKKYYFKQLTEPHKTKIAKPRNRANENYNNSYPGGHFSKGERTFYGVNGRNMRTVWVINTKPFKESHFAVFPEELPRRCIEAGCPVNGTVLDPFAGAGTTLKVAEELNRNYYGIELNKSYCKIIIKRLGLAKLC